ncbi:MAG TPA: transketolase [Acidimicrobiales bacterium]|nr:transketolase [Acidimicrobiales bacterium]
MTEADLDQLGINVIRGLAMDAPQRANSGHPGTAMALAPLAHVLWTRVMKYDPADPTWPDRDRFILSAGHACILQYAMLFLTGYGLTIEDLKEFRQWESKTPGHPEVHHTPGIEITTGPLGQGFGNAVGMGIAERWLRARFGPEITDHYTFVICSDGDLEEGISHEAASLAGHLGLGRLIYVYDDNHITIDGPTELAYNDNVPKRFQAYNWHVQDLGEAANDTDKLYRAIRRAMRVEDKPSMIVLRSHIGWPSPKFTDTAAAHGSPLGEDEVRTTKEILGLPPDETFWVPDDVLTMYRKAVPRGQRLKRKWQKAFDAWEGDRSELEACLEGRGLDGWETKLPTWQAGDKLATRKANNACINAVRDVVPGLIGGGADLTGNTGTHIEDSGVQTRDDPGGRLIYFGIREHAMGAVLNGIALHGGGIPFGGTFFNFSDYMRPAVRLAAISDAHVVYCWTHDSVGLGEDGPTHQPIEQLAEMRATPNLRVIRPADANETAQAWRVAVDQGGPTALVLTRQTVPVLEGTANGGVARGAYVLSDPVDEPKIVLIGTGSEVSVCLEAAKQLQTGGIPTRVVSMPSWELFEEQDEAYRDSVLVGDVPTLAVEAAASFGWERWADESVSIDRFGASAPGNIVLEKLGYTPENVAVQARALVARKEGAKAVE